MRDHAELPCDNFDIRWVDMGLRVSVTAPIGRTTLPTAHDSFTIGTTWDRKWTSRFFRFSCWMRDAEGCAPPPRRHLHRGSGVVSGWTTCDTHSGLLHDFPCFYALQETDHSTTSAINVPGYTVYGTDHGRTATLCPREVNNFRRSWVDNERRTAILVGSTMLLSVYMPHSCHDEADYIEALESVRVTLTEGKREGAVDFFIGGDLNLELKLDIADGEHRCIDSIEWYASQLLRDQCLDEQ